MVWSEKSMVSLNWLPEKKIAEWSTLKITNWLWFAEAKFGKNQRTYQCKLKREEEVWFSFESKKITGVEKWREWYLWNLKSWLTTLVFVKKSRKKRVQKVERPVLWKKKMLSKKEMTDWGDLTLEFCLFAIHCDIKSLIVQKQQERFLLFVKYLQERFIC